MSNRFDDTDRRHIEHRLCSLVRHVRASVHFPLDGDAYPVFRQLEGTGMFEHVDALAADKLFEGMLGTTLTAYIDLPVGVDNLKRKINFSFDQAVKAPSYATYPLRSSLPDDQLEAILQWYDTADKMQVEVNKAVSFIQNVTGNVNTPGQFRRVWEEAVPFLSDRHKRIISYAKKRSPVPDGLNVYEPEFILRRRAVTELLAKGSLMESAGLKESPPIWPR